MPQTTQYLQRNANRRRLHHSRVSDPDFRLTAEGIEEFLEISQKKGRVVGTLEW